MWQEDQARERIVGRVSVFVFSDNPEQFRADVPCFQDELRHWPMTNPRAYWDEDWERLVLEVGVTADEHDRFGFEVYAELVVDWAYKIAVGTMADIGERSVGILSIQSD